MRHGVKVGAALGCESRILLAMYRKCKTQSGARSSADSYKRRILLNSDVILCGLIVAHAD